MFFSFVSTLGDYFDALLGSQNVCQRPGDPASFRRFVDTTIVGHAPVVKTCVWEEPTHSVRDTAIDAIHQLLLLPSAKGSGYGSRFGPYGERGCDNVFADGYVMKKDGSKNTVQTNSSLLNRHVNSSIVELNKKRWKILLDRVGNAALKRMLTETSVFIALKNKNYYQMSGAPVIALARPPPGQLYVPPIQRLIDPAPDMADKPICLSGKRKRDGEQREIGLSQERRKPLKKACVSDPSNDALMSARFQAPESPCLLTVSCRNMMYSVPRMCNGRKRNGKAVSWNLPPTFVLNRCSSPDQLLRSIFAETMYTEAEMPPVLVALASRMLRLHQKFNYRFYLFKRCPAPWQNSDAQPTSDNDDASCLLDNNSKSAELPDSAPGPDACPDPDANERARPSSQRGSRSRVEQEPETESDSSLQLSAAKAPADGATGSVLEMASERSAVYQFLQLCIQCVIPRELIGGKRNHRGLYKLVHRLVYGGCFEQISLNEAIPWFVSTEVGSWLGGFAPLRAFETYALLIYWVMTEYVVEVVRHFFYVTESSSTQYALHFYRKDVWISITREPWKELVKNMYVAKDFSDLEAAGQNKCSSEFHHIRLLPKERSFRAIVNMKRAYVFRRKTPSCTDSLKTATGAAQFKMFSTSETSRQLSDALAAMRNLRQKRPEIIGSSVFSSSDMYAKLQAFKQLEQVRPLLGKQSLFMAKCDIQSAFDTIDQDKLMSILRTHVFEENKYFILYKYWLVSLTSDVGKRFAQCAVPADEAMPFGAVLSIMARWAKQTVFGDRSETRMLCSDDMLSVIERTTRQSFVRSSTGYFHQRRGIPQGSVLSTMLCNIYYARMEHDHLAVLIDPTRTMIMRLVDDFFVVSTSREQVIGLLECLMQGIPEYGCALNKEKTLVNFDAVIKGQRVNRTALHGIPWCGKLICDRTLDVMIDFGTFVQMPKIDQGMRVNTSKMNGYCQLRQRMLKAVRPRMIKLFMDCDFNSELTVTLNLYQHLLICAKKMHVYHRRIYARSTPAQLFKTIGDAIMLAYVMLRSNCGKSTLSAADVTWLGMHAFYCVLQPKQARYVELLRRIKSVIDQPKFVRFDQKFESVMTSPLNRAVLSVVY
ncbi:Telomerase reverse transcriptase [Coemansia asiatica]|nr:Telomerase reverse transcriptase [Coemansia asiatica]